MALFSKKSKEEPKVEEPKVEEPVEVSAEEVAEEAKKKRLRALKKRVKGGQLVGASAFAELRAAKLIK